MDDLLSKIQAWADSKAPLIKAVTGLAAVGLALGAAISGQWITAGASLTVAAHALTSSSQDAKK